MNPTITPSQTPVSAAKPTELQRLFQRLAQAPAPLAKAA